MTDLFSEKIYRAEGVLSSLSAARDGIDVVLRDRGLRRSNPEHTAMSLLRGAAATAALEGDVVHPDELVAGGGGPIARAALALSSEMLSLVPVWRQSPLQALARLHALAAAGSVEPDAVGRPSTPEGAARLQRLSAALVAPTEAPALVVAAVAHAEIAAGQPFGSFDGVVGRAVERLVLVERGVDPAAVLIPEVPHGERPRTYRDALDAYSDEPTAWLLYASDAFTRAAEVSPLNER